MIAPVSSVRVTIYQACRRGQAPEPGKLGILGVHQEVGSRSAIPLDLPARLFEGPSAVRPVHLPVPFRPRKLDSRNSSKVDAGRLSS